MKGALGELTVLDLTENPFVALCAAMHGDLGARVIRIDKAGVPGLCGSTALGPLVHRNKKSVVIDFSHPQGRTQFDHLLEGADVLITDWSLESLGQCGLDYDSLSQYHPGLIYARTSSLGPLGPGKHASLISEFGESRVGMMLTQPSPGQPPVYAGFGPTYNTALLNVGISLALAYRDATGEGQQVDTSFLGSAIFGATLSVQAYLSLRREALCEPMPREDHGNPMSGIGYCTSDGKWVILTMPKTDQFWSKLAPLVNLVPEDPRFDTHAKRCGDSRVELLRELEQQFLKQDANHWQRVMSGASLMFNLVGSYADAAADRLLWDNDYLIHAPDEHGVQQPSLGFPLTMSKTPAKLNLRPPHLGEHNGELLSDATAIDVALRDQVSGTREQLSGTSRSRRGALDGIRVLELGVWVQGPTAAQLLSDAGAEVLKIENAPMGGDPSRGFESLGVFPTGDWNWYFQVVNRGKRSLALDLNRAEAREIVYDLIKRSDVFLSNQLPRVLEKLGLSYATLIKLNPKLVYATNTGYGLGDRTNMPAFDLTLQALTGIMQRMGEPGQPPIYLGNGSGDCFGGAICAWGILAALRHAATTGEGQHLDASLYGSQMFLAAPSFQPYLVTGDDRFSVQQSRTKPASALWNTYRARDKWLYLCVEDSDLSWSRLCQSIGDSALCRDERFSSSALRIDNREALTAELDRRIAETSADNWIAVWQDLELPAMAIQTLADLSADEDAWANGYLLEVEWEGAGPGGNGAIRGLPIRLSKSPCEIKSEAPGLGDDSLPIITDLLEYDDEKLMTVIVSNAVN